MFNLVWVIYHTPGLKIIPEVHIVRKRSERQKKKQIYKLQSSQNWKKKIIVFIISKLLKQ